MRYETPEVVLIGQADAVILGGLPTNTTENDVSTQRADLIGYDE